MEYTREKLIEICERGIVTQTDWHDRDSAKSQCSLGEAWALLKADCEFRVLTEKTDEPTVTDKDTIWIEITFHDFNYFEGGFDEDDDGYDGKTETYYLPTERRLGKAKGGDWY